MFEKWFPMLAEIAGREAWVVHAFVIVLVALILDFVQRKALKKLQGKATQTRNLWDDAIIHALIKPVSLLIWILGVSAAGQLAANQSDSPFLEVMEPARYIGLVASLAWFLIRLVHGVEHNLRLSNRDREEPLDVTTIDALGKLVRVSIIITSILVVLQTLGVSISGILAFGGVGGLAVGLAARDLLANFFGGLTIYLDRPFAVGDWVRSPEKEIEGVVEHIGWRQTRIRKFDKRPIYVPNSAFTTLTVENPSRMTHRRIYETVGIRYQDIGQMKGIVEGVEAMLLEHPEIDQKQTLMVNFDAFNASSVDFFFYTFTRTTNWQHFHQVKQDVLLRVARIIEERGAEIAFPTRTLHLDAPESAATPEGGVA